VLEDYNLFAVLSGAIEQRHQAQTASGYNGVLRSRRAINSTSPASGLKYLYQKGRNRLLHRIRDS
jgi:hypothetical protein